MYQISSIHRYTHVAFASRTTLNVRDISASVTFAHGGGLTAVALDGHGYRRSPLAMDGGRVVLARDALYTLFSR